MVIFWDVSSRTRRGDLTLPAEAGPVFAPDGGHLASVEGEKKILLRGITSSALGGQPRELKKSNHKIGRLVFSPDSKSLASYALFTSDLKSESWLSDRPAILLWPIEGGQAPGALREYAFSEVMSFSPQAELLAVAAGEGTSLWDLATRKQIGALMEGRAMNLAFSPDGLTLAAIQEIPKQIRDKGIAEGGIALWDVGTTELLGWLPAGDESVSVETIEAQSKAAVYEAENLLQSRQVTQANAAFMKVLKFRPASAIDSYKWNNLCWLGALNGKPEEAARVMKACEYAVALDPEELGNVDTRGVARAVAGNTKGAITDFQQFIDKWDGDRSPEGAHIKEQRRGWIKALNEGKNSFTSDVLMELRKQ